MGKELRENLLIAIENSTKMVCQIDNALETGSSVMNKEIKKTLIDCIIGTSNLDIKEELNSIA